MRLVKYVALFFFACPWVFAQKAPGPYGATPSERQLNWHDIEVYGLIHFTPTTFENKEWGYGDADPSIFNPTDFDPDQIVEAARAGGLKALILVAKHHDGFCLWPTKTTEYNISKSPWKGGKGDMVREIQLACKRAGLQFGVYCSPWDRNSAVYGTAEYLNIYREQLRELYTNYGDLFMSWHDGANGGDGYYGGARETRKIDNTTYYDWENTWNGITRRLQPNACIFSDIGLDVRWVGGEEGYAANTHWATFSPEANTGTVPVPGNVNTAVSSTGTRNGEFWMPAECDVPLRPGWFYHPEQDGKEKSAQEVFNLFLKSVGRGAALDLGLAPTTAGRLHENDVKILAEFGKMVSEAFAEDLFRQSSVKASKTRGANFAVKNLTDGNHKTYWATKDGKHTAALVVSLPESREISYIQIREYIELGQRVTHCDIEAQINGKWERVASVNSIGARRIIALEKPLTTAKLRVRLHGDTALCISELAAF